MNIKPRDTLSRFLKNNFEYPFLEGHNLPAGAVTLVNIRRNPTDITNNKNNIKNFVLQKPGRSPRPPMHVKVFIKMCSAKTSKYNNKIEQ
jgi:hypothetical protein